MKFNQWLATQITIVGLERGKAAELFEISRHSLHKWLTGKAFPSMRNLRRISAIIALLRECPVGIVRREIADTIEMELST